MKNLMLALVLTAAGAAPAFAGPKCDVPEADWQPKDALETKLKADGWEVRSVKVENGCYEAYAMDANGNRVEAYFNPQTFARLDGGDADSESEE